MTANKIIETFSLTKYYRNGIIGVKNLSLDVAYGEIYGFLGSNGAGKTTTIRMLLNLLFPTNGSAEIFGKNVVKHHREICKDIGYITSSVRPHKYMTGEDFLNYMGKLSGNGDERYRQYLLEKFKFSKHDLKRKVKEYSSGMARKIALVQTFQHRPRLMIMDEPTEGLDPVMQHCFYDLLKEYKRNGGTVFISSHHLREVEQVCDRAAIIRKGQLVAVESINKLMERTGRFIEVTFNSSSPIPSISELTCDSWEIIKLNEIHLKAKITGNINTIIKLLSKHNIQDISLPHPSLQDVFLDYYEATNN